MAKNQRLEEEIKIKDGVADRKYTYGKTEHII
jgi:hypothetical protein